MGTGANSLPILNHKHNQYGSKITMNDLQKVLNRLDDFKVIEATDKKVILETPAGNITATYRIDTLRNPKPVYRENMYTDERFPLQVVFHISAKGSVVYTWGAMTNEDNSTIINFFQEKNEKHTIKKHEEDKQTTKNVSLLLNL